MSGLTKIGRSLRKNQTDAERVFWLVVRNRRFLGLKFKRQEQIEGYFVDFFCFEKSLIVEIDGGQHCESEDDKVRTACLESKGFLVKRYWNNDVLQNIEGVMYDLQETVNALTPALSQGRGGI